jgi:hypothetical protein
MKQVFEKFLNMMEGAPKETLEMSLADCHIKGVFSLVIGGSEHGRLTRVFIATKKIEMGDIQLHSHRYPLTITTLTNGFTHHIATIGGVLSPLGASSFIYKSPLNGGHGLECGGYQWFDLESTNYPAGVVASLNYSDIHTVSCKKGTMWVVEEHGFNTDSSVVLGVPFKTDGLYNAPKQFQINDMFDKVRSQLKFLIGSYEGI